MRIKHKEDKRLTIQYETGQERKKLVTAAAAILGTKSTYAGMPSAAYIVGLHSISKECALAGPDDRELVAALKEQGFEPMEETYNAEPAEPEAEANQPQPGRLTIEVPIDSSFTLIKMSNLKKLIASRETLLKKVLGTDALPIEQGDGTLRFPWFPLDISPTVVFTGGTSATSATAKFTMPAQAVTASAVYENIPATTYAVTVNSGTGGGNYAQGATVTIKATAAPTGKQFKQWNVSPAVTFTGGTSATSATAKFTMPAQTVTATAIYESIPVTACTITYNTNGGNPGTITPVTVASGTSIVLPAAPIKSGSIFKGWKTGNATLAAGVSYTVTGNVTFTAQWAKTIFSTKHEATFLNWILFFVCFGFIWRWF